MYGHQRCDDYVRDEEDDGEEHAQQHDSESGTRLDQARQRILVVLVDDQDQLDGGEDPPRVAEQGFHVSGDLEGFGAQLVEVGKVGPRLDGPVGLDDDEGDDEEPAAPSR